MTSVQILSFNSRPILGTTSSFRYANRKSRKLPPFQNMAKKDEGLSIHLKNILTFLIDNVLRKTQEKNVKMYKWNSDSQKWHRDCSVTALSPHSLCMGDARAPNDFRAKALESVLQTTFHQFAPLYGLAPACPYGNRTMLVHKPYG